MEKPIGFTFKNKHSSDFDMYVKSIDRTVKPTMNSSEITIPGRHGSYDNNINNTYSPRDIKVKCGSLKNKDWYELRKNIRILAAWLNGSGILIFDDEPDKMYNAKIYEAMSLEQVELYPGGTFDVTFHCQPFAESVQLNQIHIDSLIDFLTKFNVQNQGTVETCCTIRIKNNGNSDINKLVLIRKGEI